MSSHELDPAAAVDRLIALHDRATSSLRTCLERYFDSREPPSPAERRGFCYPELRVHYAGHRIQPTLARAYAKFESPGTYATTVTHPAHFKAYLLEQLGYLVDDYGATLEVDVSDQEIPYPYVLDRGDDLAQAFALELVGVEGRSAEQEGEAAEIIHDGPG